MREREKCAECGGALEKKTIVHFQPWDQELYRFEGVPGLVCGRCGYVWLSARISQLMDRIIRKKVKPKRYQKVPVFSFAESAKA